jgi:hypothetical protein
MFQQPVKKQTNPVIAVILVFVVFGAFVFSIADIQNTAELDGNKSHSSGIFIPVNHTIDWLVEITVYRSNRVSSSVLQTGILCILISTEICSAAECLTDFPVHIISNDISKSKDTVPLNLRI